MSTTNRKFILIEENKNSIPPMITKEFPTFEAAKQEMERLKASFPISTSDSYFEIIEVDK